MPMWKKIATFDSSKYFGSDPIGMSNIVTTDKGDKLFVGLESIVYKSVFLQSNDLSNTSKISWTKSLSLNKGYLSNYSIAIDKSGSNIYIAPTSTGSALRYNNKSGHSKSWYKSTNTGAYLVATSSNGKIVYTGSYKNKKEYLYSNTNSGKGSWTKAVLPNISINSIAMSDKGDNIYIGTDDYIWRNNNNVWTKAFKGSNSSPSWDAIAINSSGKSVYAYDSTNEILYYNHKSGKGSWKVSTIDIKFLHSLTTTSNGKSVYAVDGSMWENHNSGKGRWFNTSGISDSSGNDSWQSITTNGSGSNVYASFLKHDMKSVEIYKRISPVTTIESLKISSTGIEIGYSKKTPIVDGNIQDAFKAYLTHKADGIKSYGRIEAWDTSNVTDMFGLFYTDEREGNLYKAKQNFNDNIRNWNTSGVINMNSMFAYATSFNQPLKSWNTSGVTAMNAMFMSASNFNQPLKSWNTNKVRYMEGMFAYATSFKQDLSNWRPAITIKGNAGGFACGSPLLKSKSYWPKSSATSGNIFTKSNIGC